MASAIYNDTWAGPVEVTLVPSLSDRARFRWLRANGQVVGGMETAMPEARCIAYAKWHKSFSNVVQS